MATELLLKSEVSMMKLDTRYFGAVDYPADSVFHFPAGIPGFETERSFVFLQQEETAPVLYMQSVVDPDLCFVTLPVQSIEPDYTISLGEADRSALALPAAHPLQIGDEILCVALVSFSAGQAPSANLMAPIVVNMASRTGAQTILLSSGYSHRHPILLAGAAAC
jgi:flagellar assembly factor FliW